MNDEYRRALRASNRRDRPSLQKVFALDDNVARVSLVTRSNYRNIHRLPARRIGQRETTKLKKEKNYFFLASGIQLPSFLPIIISREVFAFIAPKSRRHAVSSERHRGSPGVFLHVRHACP